MPHKPIAGTEKALLALVSFALSVMLWLQVGAQAVPTKQREFLVRLEAKGLDAGLFVSDLPDGVTLIADGEERDIDALEPDSLAASVNVSGLAAGTHTLRVLPPSVEKEGIRLRAKRPAIEVSIDKFATAMRSVTVETHGTLEGFRQALSEPAVVTLTGPANEIGRVARVRAMVDVSLGFTQSVDLEALGDDGTPIAQVSLNPRSVLVRIEVATSLP